MASEGFVYVPPQCGDRRLAGSSFGHLQDQDGSLKKCHLHFNFHGCTTGASFVGENYIRHTGLLKAADAYNVVIVFPQTVPSFPNPLGCWDWWGYLGDTKDHAFATKNGLQMKGVAAMLQRVSGIVL